MAAGRVLVVDDEPTVRDVVARYLERDGYTVREVSDGDDVAAAIEAFHPDLIVLDIMLPHRSGLDVLRDLGNRVPVILLTARTDETDRVLGLELGADDYVVKPFSPRELVARVRSVLRRAGAPVSPTVLAFDELSIDIAAREVGVGGTTVALTAKEFDVLAYLASHPRQVFSRAQLLAAVWDSSPDFQDPATVTVHVRRLRNKIERDPEQPRWISTVWGVGYRFEPLSRRLVLRLAALAALAVALAELLLQPAAADRWHLWLIIIGPAVFAIAATPLLAHWVKRRASVAGVALTVALCSLALGAVSSSAASNAMFVSSHDYRLFLVVLLVSSGIALIVGSQLTRPLARDLHRLGQVASDVTEGDLSVRTGIDRADEVGAAAQAIDTMVQTLAMAEAERGRLAAARQHLFTSIGHDLRTPLAAMRAAVESIEDGVATDPRHSLAVLSSQLRAMDAMLNQLIEFSRLESGHVTTEVERVSLTELADECIEALTPLATARKVRLVLSADGPAIVTGNALELSRVLRNLVDNAVRHSPDDGEVTIVLEGDGHEMRLSVIDRGDGFPPEFRDRAFEPFHRADPSRNARTGNTGLGLAICRAIVQSHGGTISLGDGPSGQVHVVLPASPPRSVPHPTIGAFS